MEINAQNPQFIHSLQNVQQKSEVSNFCTNYAMPNDSFESSSKEPSNKAATKHKTSFGQGKFINEVASKLKKLTDFPSILPKKPVTVPTSAPKAVAETTTAVLDEEAAKAARREAKRLARIAKADNEIAQILASPKGIEELESVLSDKACTVTFYREITTNEGTKIISEPHNVKEIIDKTLAAIKPAEVEGMSFFHGTTKSKIEPILKNGFDINRSGPLSRDAGKGVYFGLNEAEIRELYSGVSGDVLSIKLADGTKIARIDLPKDFSLSRSSIISKIADGAEDCLRHNKLFSKISGATEENINGIIKEYIVKKIKEKGYSGLLTSSPLAGCEYLCMYDPSKIKITNFPI